MTTAESLGVVRRLTPNDLDRVAEIDQAAAGRSRRGFFENRVAASLAEPAAFISLGYTENGVVQGFALGHRLDGEFGGQRPVVVIDALGVEAAARGHGGAQDLMKQLQAEAR